MWLHWKCVTLSSCAPYSELSVPVLRVSWKSSVFKEIKHKNSWGQTVCEGWSSGFLADQVDSTVPGSILRLRRPVVLNVILLSKDLCDTCSCLPGRDCVTVTSAAENVSLASCKGCLTVYRMLWLNSTNHTLVLNDLYRCQSMQSFFFSPLMLVGGARDDDVG